MLTAETLGNPVPCSRSDGRRVTVEPSERKKLLLYRMGHDRARGDDSGGETFAGNVVVGM